MIRHHDFYGQNMNALQLFKKNFREEITRKAEQCVHTCDQKGKLFTCRVHVCCPCANAHTQYTHHPNTANDIAKLISKYHIQTQTPTLTEKMSELENERLRE